MVLLLYVVMYCCDRFANQTTYVILYGLVGCVFSMTYAYFNGTLTTLEKRFKIPSKNTGIIAIGNNITQMTVSAVLSYYAGKGHRPRWIGFGEWKKQNGKIYLNSSAIQLSTKAL